MKNRGRQKFNRKGEPLFRCPFPDCGAVFAKETGKPNTCLRHRKLIDDVAFILNHMASPEPIEETKEAGPKIFVPRPGMSLQAIQESLKNSKGG